MKNKQNLHTHTSYSDGKDSPEELIVEAINRGFDAIGFSEHSFNEFSTYPFQMSIEQTDTYKKEISMLKNKYKGIIDVFCGLEYEMLSRIPTDDFDYLIGSVHYLNCDGEFLGFDIDLQKTLNYVNENFSGDGLSFAKKYFETIALLPTVNKFDIIGHFDILTKNNELGHFVDTSSKKYLDFAFGAIHELRGKIPLFEVNTGAISRGYRTSPYPQFELLKEFKNCGFGAIISSDCHDKNFIDCYFDETEALLLEAGFKSKYILTANGFKEIGL